MSANEQTKLMTAPTPAGDPIDLRAAAQMTEITIYDPSALDEGNRGAWISAHKEWVGDRVNCR